MSADTVFWMSLLEKLKWKSSSWFSRKQPDTSHCPGPLNLCLVTPQNQDFPSKFKDYSGALLFDSNTWIEELQYIPPQLSLKTSKHGIVPREVALIKSCLTLPIGEAVFRQTCPVIQHQPRIEVRNVTIPIPPAPLAASMPNHSLDFTNTKSVLLGIIVQLFLLLVWLFWSFIKTQSSATGPSHSKTSSEDTHPETPCTTKVDESKELLSVTQCLKPYQAVADEPITVTAANLRVRVSLGTCSRAMLRVAQAKKKTLVSQLNQEKAVNNIYHKLYQCFRHGYMQLRIKNSELEARMKAVEEEKQLLESRHKELGQKLTKQRLEVGDMEEEKKIFDALKKSLTTEKETLDIEKKSFDTKKKSFDTGNKTLETKKKSFEADKKSFDTDKKTFDADKKSFDTEKKSFDTEKKSFATEKKTFDTEKAQLQKNLGTSANEKTELKKDLDNLATEKAQLKKDLANSVTEKTQLKKDLDISGTETRSLKKTVNDLEQKLIDKDLDQVETAEEHKKILNSEKTQLRKELETTKTETQSLKKTIEDLQQKLVDKDLDHADTVASNKKIVISEKAQLKKELLTSETEIQSLKKTNGELVQMLSNKDSEVAKAEEARDLLNDEKTQLLNQFEASKTETETVKNKKGYLQRKFDNSDIETRRLKQDKMTLDGEKAQLVHDLNTERSSHEETKRDCRQKLDEKTVETEKAKEKVEFLKSEKS